MKKPVTKKPVTRAYTIRLEPPRPQRRLVYWSVSLVDLIGSTPSNIFSMLKKSGLLGKLQFKCPECGTVQSADSHGCRYYAEHPWMRCSVRNCRARWHVLHDHVLFTTARNSATLAVQCQVIFNFCAKVSQASCHLLLNISHCLVESIYARCRDHLS
eukprot:6272267-Amphidinium_carterae.1